MKIHDFKESIKAGSAGEKIIEAYIKSLASTKDLKDVRKDKKYQKIDVDFLWTNILGEEYTVEVKTDSYTSKNIFYETISCVETNSIGCLDKTETDFIFYYYSNKNELYIIKMKEYKEWFDERIDGFNQKGYKKTFKNKRFDNSFYTTEGYAFPVKLLEDSTYRWVRKINMKGVS